MLKRLLGNMVVITLAVVAVLAVAEVAVPYLVPLRNVGASFTQYDPVMWKRLKPDFQTTRVTPEFTMRFSTNSLGARGPEPKAPLKGPILFLGDSFTMGYGVSDGQEYPALVQQELERRFGERSPYVLNLGMGASGNGFWLKHLTHTAPNVQPSLVVMQVLENDFWDNQVENLYNVDAAGQLVELPVPQPDVMRRIQNIIERLPGLAGSNLVGLVRQAISGIGPKQNPLEGVATAAGPVKDKLDPGEALTIRIVETAIRRCQQNGWPVVLMAPGLRGAQQIAIRELAQAMQVPLLELPSKQDRPDLYYAIDGHWNMAGHADAARRLLEKLDEVALPPAPPYE